MEIPSLRASPRLPVLFVGHGSPLNVIQPNAYRPGWEALGAEFGRRWPRPALILCISAHWLTQGWWLTGMAQPPTIHDFGGFPQALFEQQYPAPGAPELAQALAAALRQPDTEQPLAVDTQDWGLDHGCWGVLKPMFPQADIPVIQLSIDYSQPPEAQYALGRQLRGAARAWRTGAGQWQHRAQPAHPAARGARQPGLRLGCRLRSLGGGAAGPGAA